MKPLFAMSCGVMVSALALLPLEAAAQVSAPVVGEYNVCGTENLSVPATAAGYSWVSVGTLDAASLQGLDALVYRTCSAYASNQAINDAVAAGMDLVLDAATVNANDLPGSPALNFTTIGLCETNYSLVAGAPITTGPGGTLTDDSLDVGAPGGTGGFCSFLGSTPAASLPAGAAPFFSTTDGTNITALGYSAGAGQVAVSISQFSNSAVYTPSQYLYAGAKTYFINSLAWGLATGQREYTTCASEGYTYTKLRWCQEICEKGNTGATLDMWIHRWTNRYRDLPYCAVEDAPPPPPQGDA